MRTSVGPLPCSWSCMPSDSRSVPQRLPRLQSVTDAFERLRLPAELQERLTLQIEQVLFAHNRLMRKRAARQHERESATDQRIVIADAARSPREMHAELERGEQARSAHRDLARCCRAIAA